MMSTSLAWVKRSAPTSVRPHPLLVPDGAHALWGWVSTTGAPGVAPGDLAPLADQVPETVRVTLGTPAQGAAGFRDSHVQAQRGRRIIELTGRAAPVTAYAEVALVDTMSGDLDLARAFVASELGGSGGRGAPGGGGTAGAAGSARRTGWAGGRSRRTWRTPEHRAAAPAPGRGTARASRYGPCCRAACGAAAGPGARPGGAHPGTRPNLTGMCCAHTGVGSAPLVAACSRFVPCEACQQPPSNPRPQAARHALPDPGVGVPAISWPIVGIFCGAIAVIRVLHVGGGGRQASCPGDGPAERDRDLRAVHRAARCCALLGEHPPLGQRGLRSSRDALRLAADLVQVVRVHPHRAPPQHQ